MIVNSLLSQTMKYNLLLSFFQVLFSWLSTFYEHRDNQHSTHGSLGYTWLRNESISLKSNSVRGIKQFFTTQVDLGLLSSGIEITTQIV